MKSLHPTAGRCARLGLVFLTSFLTSFLTTAPFAQAQYPSGPQITKDGTTVLIEDYASLPLSGLRLAPWVNQSYPGPIDPRMQLGRVNMIRSEPSDAASAATRFFVVEQNGVLYVLDKTSRKFTTYLDLGSVYPRFNTEPYLTNGIASMAFDPAYAKNGKFYTVHSENVAIAQSASPSAAKVPGLKLAGFSLSAPVNISGGDVAFECVITEWTDTNIKNSTFEGTAREVLRAGYGDSLHPMYDTLFNPLARPGDADYGNLYVSLGDGGTGERAGPLHTIPQRLDALLGKIVRITPDITLHPQDKLSTNGRYRIPSTGPDPNPFVATSGARGEIYAVGFRSPIRMSWDAVTNTHFVDDIGFASWEEVNIVTKGANYGWAEREGPEQIFEIVGGTNNGRTGSQVNPPVPFPSPDTLTVEGLADPVTPVYPAAVFSHRESTGDATGGGFVYRGKLMPQLVGKYIFSELVSGRLFYSDLAEMIASRGSRGKQAVIHELQVVYKSPYKDAPQGAMNRRMYDIVVDGFLHKEGVSTPPCVLPDGGASRDGLPRKCGTRGTGVDPYGVKYGGGRSDVRVGMDGDGEVYLLSKTDGMIRKMVSVVTPPPASN